MSSHERFRELSALAAVGQLSADEDRELNAHLRECADCREAHADYARVVRHQLPHVESLKRRAGSAAGRVAVDPYMRDRFLARARAEGIELSLEAESPSGKPSSARVPWFPSRGIRWGLAAVAAVGLLSVGVDRNYVLVRRTTANAIERHPVLVERASSAAELEDLERTLRQKNDEVEELRREKATSEKSLEQLEAEIQEARLQVEKLSASLQEAESANTRLSGGAQMKDAMIADLKAKNDKLANESADQLADRVVLAEQVRDLTASLREERSNTEREKELSSVAEDVRELMGARNLHIIDVHDVDGGGKSAKAFGRVFYAEGQSLIFYAFDLPSGKLTPAKYSFEAWGQREYVSGSVRNLGTFAVDDHVQRRWVLKVTDPSLLRDIDSVFVTAESPTDMKEPRGKKLLYAYIVGQPNHP